MLNQTDRVDGIALLLFKLQSPLLRFSINRHSTGPSFRRAWLKQVHKQITKRCFELFDMHFSKKTLDRRLMGSDALLNSERLFDLLSLFCSPLCYVLF